MKGLRERLAEAGWETPNEGYEVVEVDQAVAAVVAWLREVAASHVAAALQEQDPVKLMVWEVWAEHADQLAAGLEAGPPR